jgi:hypothetical protein
MADRKHESGRFGKRAERLAEQYWINICMAESLRLIEDKVIKVVKDILIWKGSG